MYKKIKLIDKNCYYHIIKTKENSLGKKFPNLRRIHMKKIAVIGSMNADLVFEMPRVPQKGETISGTRFHMGIGGKGANQAVAAARLGGDVTFFGSIGKDIFGTQMREKLKKENIKTCLNESTRASGVAEVNVYENDNSIVVIPGANADFNEGFMRSILEQLDSFDIFVFQLEICIDVIERLITKIRELSNKIILLNPAPAKLLSAEMIAQVDYITPNEHEIYEIGIANHDLEDILKQYPNKILVTQGEAGVAYYDDATEETVLVPALRDVEIIDTTGAGDTFSGAFAYALSTGLSLRDAIRFANVAAGISIRKLGAQEGMPTMHEVEQALQVENK